MLNRKLPPLVSVLVLGCVILGGAGIYKYQDADGEWHFTDKPPRNQDVEVIQSESTPPTPADGGQVGTDAHGKDLGLMLTQKAPPSNNIERAAISVVSVHTNLGKGSGFFVTRNGHLITGKHVVRPTITSQWREDDSEFQERKDAAKQARHALDARTKAMTAAKQELEARRQAIRDADNARLKKRAEERYLAYKENYEQRMAELNRDERAVRGLERRVRQERTERNIASSLSKLAQNFEVHLRDGSKLQARLLAESNNFDLALLKIDGYQTPLLPLSRKSVAHGMRIYSLSGASLMGRSVTSGIVTGSDENWLYTDARLLLGNSGGPLIDEEGHVIGVAIGTFNESSPMPDMGLAIPISRVKSEFSRYL